MLILTLILEVNSSFVENSKFNSPQKLFSLLELSVAKQFLRFHLRAAQWSVLV